MMFKLQLKCLDSNLKSILDAALGKLENPRNSSESQFIKLKKYWAWVHVNFERQFMTKISIIWHNLWLISNIFSFLIFFAVSVHKNQSKWMAIKNKKVFGINFYALFWQKRWFSHFAFLYPILIDLLIRFQEYFETMNLRNSMLLFTFAVHKNKQKNSV